MKHGAEPELFKTYLYYKNVNYSMNLWRITMRKNHKITGKRLFLKYADMMLSRQTSSNTDSVSIYTGERSALIHQLRMWKCAFHIGPSIRKLSNYVIRIRSKFHFALTWIFLSETPSPVLTLNKRVTFLLSACFLSTKQGHKFDLIWPSGAGSYTVGALLMNAS